MQKTTKLYQCPEKGGGNLRGRRKRGFFSAPKLERIRLGGGGREGEGGGGVSRGKRKTKGLATGKKKNFKGQREK